MTGQTLGEMPRSVENVICVEKAKLVEKIEISSSGNGIESAQMCRTLGCMWFC